MPSSPPRLCLALLTLWLSACTAAGPAGAPPAQPTAPAVAAAAPAPPAPPPPAPPPPVRIQLVATGDLLMHLPLVQQSYVPTTGRYDFLPMLQDVLPHIRAADLAIAQLETTLAGVERGLAGYPLFNSPSDLAHSLKAAGYHAVTHANNHTLDFGLAGVAATIAALEQAGLHHTGAFRTPAERDRLLLIPVRGVQVALLAYAQHTNGIPRSEPHLVNLIADGHMAQDIRRARAAGAHLVVVALHAGEEDRHTPEPYQREWVHQAAAAGADVILGCHPHVLQPIEVLRVPDPAAPGGTRRVAAIYSMGNFVGVQYGLPNNTGVLFRVAAVHDPATGRTEVEEVSYIPTWIQRRNTPQGRFSRVVAVEQALYDYEHGLDGHLGPADHTQLRRAWKESNAILGADPEARLHRVAPQPPGP